MTASATDIITYIGVPLAVLGVLPILTVALKTLLFSFRVRGQLRKNLDVIGLHQTPIWPFQSPHASIKVGKDSTLIPGKHYFQDVSYYSIDVDVLAGQITVSYPVLRLSPPPIGNRLYRSMRPPADKDRSYRSRLKGGTWSILYFEVEVVPEDSSRPDIESRNYDLKPTSRVCQRAALINFADLVDYLMDLGADLDWRGYYGLLHHERSWITQDIVLLKTVYPINTNPEEEDGIPILVMRKQEEEEDDRLLAMMLNWQEVTQMISEANSGERHATVVIRHFHRLSQLQQGMNPVTSNQGSVVQLEISSAGITQAQLEKEGEGIQPLVNVAHLTANSWFNSLAAVIGARQKVSKTYIIPVSTFEFARETFDSDYGIPCGVLQECGLVSTESFPINCATEDIPAVVLEENEHGTKSKDIFSGLKAGEFSPGVTEKIEENRISCALQTIIWNVSTMARNMREDLVSHYLASAPPRIKDEFRTGRDWNEEDFKAALWWQEIAERVMYALIHTRKCCEWCGMIWAKFSDIWGRKPILLVAVAVFFASSILCALSINMKMLIAGRAIQGAAGGGLVLLVNITVSDLFSVRNRSLYLGLLEFVWAFAAGIGPILGGAFTEYVSWRWNWWINLPIQGTTFLLLLLFLDVHNPRTKVMDGIKAIDWFGCVTMLGLILMLLLGLDFGGETFPWNSPTVICLIVFGALMSLFFIYSEKRLARYPLMPLTIFSHRSNIASLLVCATHGFALIAAEYYLPLYFQAVHSTSPLLSGVLILPAAVTTAIVGIIVGFVIHRTGRYLECMYLGTAMLTLGMGLFIQFKATTSLGTVVGIEIIEGIGAGLLFEPPLIAIQSMVSQDDTATATSTFGFVRSVGTCLSIVICGVVFQNSMQMRVPFLQAAGLPINLVQKFSGKDAAANVMLIHTMADPAHQLAVKEAFAWSMRNMWILCTSVGACGFVVSFFITKQHLKQEHTETVTGLKKEKAPEVEMT